MKQVNAYVYFENGCFMQAQSFGAEGTFVGEVVFNTALTGYQEIISDPSYAGQFIAFSMPEIGIVGCNPKDMESRGVFAQGILVHHYSSFVSNFRASQNLGMFLKEYNVMGLCSLPMRKIIKMIREEGAMMMIASTEINDKEQLKEILQKKPQIESLHLVQQVSTKKPYYHNKGTFCFDTMDFSTPPTNKKIVVIDFGVKNNILNNLVNAGFSVEVIPYFFDAQELIRRFENKEIDAVFLSNGPGNPSILHNEIEQIKLLIQSHVPIFAICLGHQLICIAQGYPTYKLKFGHHGGNHPVKNLCNETVEITAQNHIYSAPDSIVAIADITHRNLFDGTIEGLLYHDKKIFSIQYHPESSPGPQDSTHIFKEFMAMLQ